MGVILLLYILFVFFPATMTGRRTSRTGNNRLDSKTSHRHIYALSTVSPPQIHELDMLTSDCSPAAGFLWSRGISMPIAASLETQGNSGFEAFSVDGITYIAASNFWDGKTSDMSAYSSIYTADWTPSSGGGGGGDNYELSINEVRRYKTWGAHSVDFFEVNHDDKQSEKFLVTTNYYKCNSFKEEPEKCFPVNILKYSSDAVAFEDRFTSFTDLRGKGPAQSDHFYFDGGTFLVVADNFASKVTIYKYIVSGSEWLLFQELYCAGVAAIAVAHLDNNDILLVAASYHNNGWKTRSPVFKMSSSSSKFIKIQEIDTLGAHDVEIFTFKNQVYLFTSEDRDEATPFISSKILHYNSKDGKFVVIQSIPTHGAHAAELFEISGSLYLAIANFGDRHGKEYAAVSTLWMLTPGGKFELACNINTQGATDFEHFRIDDADFLIASNEGNLEEQKFQYSVVYRIALKPHLLLETVNEL